MPIRAGFQHLSRGWSKAHVRLLCAVSLGLICLFGQVRAALADTFTVDVSAPLVGDGVSEVALPIATAQGSVILATQVRATVNAGTIRVQPDANGRALLMYVPPHVAEKWTANLEVSVAGFSPSVLTTRIRVVPPRKTLSYRKSPGEIGLQVPREFILGEHTSATLTLEGILQKPLLSVSTGLVSSLTSKSAGVWVATFSPPEGRFPQRVLVVASSEDGSRLHFDHFDLLGKPSVETHSEPGAIVKVKVANQTFGPLRANSRGRLRLMLLAPPGVEVAQVTATDSAGNARVTPVSLGAPDFNLIHIICPEHSGRFLVFGTSPNGAWLNTFAGSLITSVGTLTKPIQMMPGFFEAEVTVPDGTDPETQLTLRASLNSSAASRAVCVTPVPGEAPKVSRLTLGSSEYREGTGPVDVELKLTYPDKTTPRPVTVRLTANHGRILDQNRINPTTITARWEPPASLEEIDQVLFQAEVARLPGLTARANLPVVSEPDALPEPESLAFGLMARAGYLSNFGQVSSPFFALGATFELPQLARGLAAGIELGHFSSRRDARTDAAQAGSSEVVSVNARGIPLVTRMTLERRFERLGAYAGIGVGLVFAHTEVSSTTIGKSNEDSTLFLARALVGASYALPVGKAGVEGGYVYCPMDGNTTSGNLCGVDITATYHYPF